MNNPNYAVRFGEAVDMGLETQQAFPFIYNMVNKEDDHWVPQTPIVADPILNLSGDSINVPASSYVRHPIRLDPDYNFRLLWLKYSVCAPFLVGPPGYYWYAPTPAWAGQLGDDYQTQIGTPLIRAVRVSIDFLPDTRYLYGGQNLDQAQNSGTPTGAPPPAGNNNAIGSDGGATLPLPLTCIQGYDFGMGQIRTPYLLPRSGTIMMTIHNIANLPVLVAGILYGMKVRP